MTVPVDLDPGWDHNPGKARMDKLRQLEKEKALQLKPGMQRALKQGAQAAQQAKQKYLTQLAANTALKKLGQASVDGTFAVQKQKAIQKAAQHQDNRQHSIPWMRKPRKSFWQSWMRRRQSRQSPHQHPPQTQSKQ